LGGLFTLASASTLAVSGGCNIVATAMYVITGNVQQAECKVLDGKRVAVVCRPVTSLQYRNSGVARDLAKNVGQLLTKNCKKVEIVPPREIAQWADENSWEEYIEIGRAVNADYVVGIDLEEFGLYQGQTLYQGKANCSLVVYDVKKGGEPVYEKSLPQTLFPPTGGIAASEKPEAQFRRQFLFMLSEQLARHFYDHDPTSDFAADSTSLN
jgi:hypothetical protein